MASVKFGGGITEMSGSIAGTVFARNRFGFYTRPRTKPVNPNSVLQGAARTLIKYLTDYWSGPNMDDTKRGSWATYAAAIAMKNRLGEVIYITGFNHFIRSNAARMIVGGALLKSAPTTLSLPGSDPTIAVTGDAGTQLLTIAFDEAQEWTTEPEAFLSLSMGQPQIATRNFFGGPYRNAGGLEGIVSAGIQSPQTVVAPFTLVTGQKVWINARIIRADGRTSNPFFAPALIVGGLLPEYHATGTLSPNITLYNFMLMGAFNGKAYYKAVGASYYLWWDASANWYISAVLGTPGTSHWLRNDPAVAGAYAPTVWTGTATVVAGAIP